MNLLIIFNDFNILKIFKYKIKKLFKNEYKKNLIYNSLFYVKNMIFKK